MTSLAARKAPSILRDMARNVEELFGKIEQLPPSAQNRYPELIAVAKDLQKINSILRASAEKGAITLQQRRSIAAGFKSIAASVEKGARTRR